MRPLLLTLLLALPYASTHAAPVAAGVGPHAPARAATPLELRSVPTPDGLRWYRVATPPGHDPARAAAPLAILFHGGGGNALAAAEAYGVVEEGLRRGYVVAVPEGTGPLGGPPLFTFQTWNGGDCCGYAQAQGIDDLAFVEALVDALGATEGVDPGRVFATGFSNGALLTYRLAAERPDLVRAVAPVGGSFEGPVDPSEPVPLLAIFGLLDENVPFGGGQGSGLSGTDFESQLDSLLPFLAANGGAVPSGPVPLEQALFFAAPGGPGGAATLYYLALDGGHTWPGGAPSVVDPDEPQHTALPATPLVFDFFDLYR